MVIVTLKKCIQFATCVAFKHDNCHNDNTVILK